MSRKSLAGVILLVFLTSAAVAVAAEKMDNVFIVGLDAGYYGGTGWLGSNMNGGVGGAIFFGYGITNNFAIELDYIPDVIISPKSSEIPELDKAYFGGIGQEFSGMGGIGVSGKLYPRERFRDADYVLVQPFIRMGLGWMPFIWSYNYAEIQKKVDSKIYRDLNVFGGEDYDGFNNVYFNLGGGVDFMLAKWVSLGLDLRLWKYFVVGDSINGYKTNGFPWKDDFASSMTYSAGLNVTFQW